MLMAASTGLPDTRPERPLIATGGRFASLGPGCPQRKSIQKAIDIHGDAISPPLLGAIAGHSWNAALYVVCAVMVLAAVLWFSGTGFLKRDTDRVEGAGQQTA